MEIERMEDYLPDVRFKQEEIGIDQDATDREGYLIPKIVNVIEIQNDQYTFVVHHADEWFARKKEEAKKEQFPPKALKALLEQYDDWKEGYEIPLNGIPLEHCTAFRRVQVEHLRNNKFRTVEDVAKMNEDQIEILGPGARNYKEMAIRYIENSKQTADAKQVADIVSENKSLHEEMKRMQDKLRELNEQVKAKK